MTIRMESLIENPASAKLSSLLEVVRLTYEEGLELGQMLAAAQLDEDRAKRETRIETPDTSETEPAEDLRRQQQQMEEEEQHSDHSDQPSPQQEQASQQEVEAGHPKQAEQPEPHSLNTTQHQQSIVTHQPLDSTTEVVPPLGGPTSDEPHQQAMAMTEHKQRVQRHLQQEQAVYPHQQMYPYHLQRLSQSQPCPVEQALDVARATAPVGPQKGAGSSGGKLLCGGPCESCGAKESPQWRRPEPARLLLCNRCGIHYGRYKKLPGKKAQEANPAGSSGFSGRGSGSGGHVTTKRKSTDISGDFECDQLSRECMKPPLNPMYQLGRSSRIHDGRQAPVAHASLSGLPPVYRERRSSFTNASSHNSFVSDIRAQRDGGDCFNLGALGGDYGLGQGAMEYILTHGSSLDFIPVRREPASSAAAASHLQQPLEQPQYSAAQFHSQPPSHWVHPSLGRSQQQPPAQATQPDHPAGGDAPEDKARGKKVALQRKLQRLFSSDDVPPPSAPTLDPRSPAPVPALNPSPEPHTIPQQPQSHTAPYLTELHGYAQSQPASQLSLYPDVQHVPHSSLGSSQQGAGGAVGPSDLTVNCQQQSSQAKHQHFIFCNGLLTGADGAPVDAATYNSVLSTLAMQQQGPSAWATGH